MDYIIRKEKERRYYLVFLVFFVLDQKREKRIFNDWRIAKNSERDFEKYFCERANINIF